MTKFEFMKPLFISPQPRFLAVILALAISSVPVASWTWDPALVLGSSEDNPHMVFYDAEHGALIYATRLSGTWCLQTIEDDPNESIRIGRDPAIVMDGHGAIHVSYHYHEKFSVCQVKYAVSQPLPGQ